MPPPKTILFIEDDEAFAYAVTRVLESAGYRVLGAPSFTGALSLLEDDIPIDLMLTDVLAPLGQPHGFALARMARHRRTSLPILYLTGLTDIPEPERDGAFGRILSKPVEPAELIAAIEAELQRNDVPGPGGP